MKFKGFEPKLPTFEVQIELVNVRLPACLSQEEQQWPSGTLGMRVYVRYSSEQPVYPSQWFHIYHKKSKKYDVMNVFLLF